MKQPGRAAPDVSQLLSAMHALIDRLFRAMERDDAFDESLDILIELLGADRALVLLTYDSGATQAVNARSQRRTLSSFEQEEISRTILERAGSEGRCVVWAPRDDDDVSESVADLGISLALAAPLFHRV